MSLPVDPDPGMSLPVGPDHGKDPPAVRPSASIGWPIGGGLALALTLTLLVGLQLGAVPWRFRRQLWQLQGGLAGAAVGLVVGYALGRRRREGRGGAP